MNTIAERLRTLRKEQNLSKRDLVSTLPLNYSTYANYESGFREPNSEVLLLLSRHFGVSIDYLMGASENRKRADEVAILSDCEHDHLVKYRKLDGYGLGLVNMVMDKELERAAASAQGTSTQTSDEWVRLQVFEQSTRIGNYLDSAGTVHKTMKLNATPISTQADFCIKIEGESMEPKIHAGDIVLVKATPKVDIDSVGIFIYEGEVLCKRLRLDIRKSELTLESLNKAYAPKKITNPDRLQTVGLVIGIAENL